LELLEFKDHILAYEWGEALYNDGRYTEALQAFDIYIQHAENPELALLKQIPIYIKLQDYETALKKIATARKQQSDLLPNDFLDFHAGEILFYLEDYTEALKYLKQLTGDTTSYQEEAIYLIGRIAFANDQLHRAYHAMRYTSELGFEPATTFLREELYDFFNFFLVDFFKVTEDLIADNANSPFVQKHQGKVWCFQDIEGDSLKEYSPELAANLKKEMAITTLIITDKAFIKLSKSAVTLYAYKITNETESGISFPVKSIHKTNQKGAELEIELRLNEEGLLEYEDNLNENSVMIFKEISPEMLSEEAVSLFQQFIHQETFEQLGDVVKPVAQHIWKQPLLLTS
jgi:tetratricopeptide (TPR) repeat protein